MVNSFFGIIQVNYIYLVRIKKSALLWYIDAVHVATMSPTVRQYHFTRRTSWPHLYAISAQDRRDIPPTEVGRVLPREPHDVCQDCGQHAGDPRYQWTGWGRRGVVVYRECENQLLVLLESDALDFIRAWWIIGRRSFKCAMNDGDQDTIEVVLNGEATGEGRRV